MKCCNNWIDSSGSATGYHEERTRINNTWPAAPIYGWAPHAMPTLKVGMQFAPELPSIDPPLAPPHDSVARTLATGADPPGAVVDLPATVARLGTLVANARAWVANARRVPCRPAQPGAVGHRSCRRRRRRV
jgi:hypothetical protein